MTACARFFSPASVLWRPPLEKSQEIVDDLVKKGELTVEQGKALNAELKHKVQEAKEASEEAKPEAETETKAE